jgi:hypothetical protein
MVRKARGKPKFHESLIVEQQYSLCVFTLAFRYWREQTASTVRRVTMPRSSLGRPHEQQKIAKLLTRFAEMKRNPKPQAVKRASS